VIEAHALTKDYGDKRAVDDLSFTVRPGIVTGFLGPNGSGKSTTMRLVLGLDAATSGDVTVNGKHYRDHPAPLHEVGGAARGPIRPHGPLRVQPPARARADARDPAPPR
jgi:ABC-2 type transport system ATP-binding protein